MSDKLVTEQPIGYSNKTLDHSTQFEKMPFMQINVPNATPKAEMTDVNIANISQKDSQFKQQSLAQLKAQNKQLRAANRQLRKKLQNFQKRLDESLKKHRSQHVKQKLGQEIVESMELKNAYKMCQIYKKQISFLKKKQTLNKESRIDQLNQIIAQLQRDKQKLIEEIKDLKKLNRQQDKGLRQMVGPNFMRLMNQNENLKEQMRIIQQRSSANESKNSYAHRRLDERKDKKSFQSQNNQLVKILKNEGDNRQINQIQHLKNKILKDNRKISMLMSQNSRLRQNVEELRSQMIQKDKQFYQLRSKLLNNMKREEKQSNFKRKRMETEPKMSIKKQINQKQEQGYRYKQQTQLKQHHRKIKSQVNTMQIGQTILRQKPKQQKIRVMSIPVQQYPRILEIGEKDAENYRWNHQQFSSKIKEVQVSKHLKGYVMEINFRYLNGQPKKISKNPYATFCCEQNSDEHIVCIKGGFKTGLLRYISLQTSKGRKSNFCQLELKNECINFEFRPRENEYLGAFFGQNSPQGITRLGCYIELERSIK